MAFFLIWIAIFVIFFHPECVFSNLASAELPQYFIIAALFAHLISGKKSRVNFLSEKTNIFFILFALMQIVGSFTIRTYEAILSFNVWLRFGVVYYLIVGSITSLKKAKAIIWAIVLGISYLVYYFIANHVMSYVPGKIALGYGWYANANDLVLILATVVPLALIFFNLSKSLVVKIFIMVFVVLSSISIVFSLSRGGALSLLIVGLLSLFFSNKISNSIKIFFSALLIALIVSVGVKNILTRRDLMPGSLSGDVSSENRIIQWRARSMMIMKKPIFGVGRGKFKYYVHHYGGIKRLQPHNTLIQVFAETGIPGGIFYLLFSFLPFYEGFKILRQYKENKQALSEAHVILRFVLIALVGFWVCAFFGNRYNEYVLYVLVGIVIAVKNNLINKVHRTERIVSLSG